MESRGIIAEIDAEIARLQQARALLSGGSVTARPGRPKGSTNTAKPQRRKRVLSADARRRIAEAQKRRWAERRKAAGTK